jgi:hypothetical protein
MAPSMVTEFARLGDAVVVGFQPLGGGFGGEGPSKPVVPLLFIEPERPESVRPIENFDRKYYESLWPLTDSKGAIVIAPVLPDVFGEKPRREVMYINSRGTIIDKSRIGGRVVAAERSNDKSAIYLCTSDQELRMAGVSSNIIPGSLTLHKYEPKRGMITSERPLAKKSYACSLSPQLGLCVAADKSALEFHQLEDGRKPPRRMEMGVEPAAIHFAAGERAMFVITRDGGLRKIRIEQ